VLKGYRAYHSMDGMECKSRCGEQRRNAPLSNSAPEARRWPHPAAPPAVATGSARRRVHPADRRLRAGDAGTLPGERGGAAPRRCLDLTGNNQVDCGGAGGSGREGATGNGLCGAS